MSCNCLPLQLYSSLYDKPGSAKHFKQNSLTFFIQCCSLSIFEPWKVPKPDSVALPTYGDDSVEELIAHYTEKMKMQKQWMEKKPWYPLKYLPGGKHFAQPWDSYYCITAERTCFQWCSRQCFPICLRLPPLACQFQFLQLLWREASLRWWW